MITISDVFNKHFQYTCGIRTHTHTRTYTQTHSYTLHLCHSILTLLDDDFVPRPSDNPL